MNTFKYILIPLIFIALQFSSSAQISTNEQLAIQFHQNKEYDKALDYYEYLFNKKSQEQFYASYLDCLLKTKNYKKAEKITKKIYKKHPHRLSYRVDLGYVYLLNEDLKKSKGTWNIVIKSLSDDDQTLAVAKAFIAIQQYDLAIKTYLRGRKVSVNDYPFSFELANVYKSLGDKAAMINEYMDVLEIEEAYIQTIQNELQTSFGENADTEQNILLKRELLKRIQRKPNKTVLSELLIWMQLKENDFEGAFIQAKALDKRNKEPGNRIIALANIFLTANDYTMAIKAYKYIIKKGKDGYFYKRSRIALLDVYYTKITLNNNPITSDIIELEATYKRTIEELGKTASSIPLFKNLAHLQAFYLHQTNDAISLIQEVFALNILNKKQKAEFKLELADIYLMSGEIWDASLLYSQVEKSFKYDAIGQEAKFRNAKVSYYTFDFNWAQAQLNVLKGATAKLISNDALDLSLLISDALSIDTNTAPLILFSQSELLLYQNKDSLAIILLDSIINTFNKHSLVDEALFKKGELASKNNDYITALKHFENIVNNFGNDILGDDALFKIGLINETQINNPEKAKEIYQQLLTDYPGSLYVIDARKRFRNLRGDDVN